MVVDGNGGMLHNPPGPPFLATSKFDRVCRPGDALWSTVFPSFPCFRSPSLLYRLCGVGWREEKRYFLFFLVSCASQVTEMRCCGRRNWAVGVGFGEGTLWKIDGSRWTFSRTRMRLIYVHEEPIRWLMFVGSTLCSLFPTFRIFECRWKCACGAAMNGSPATR